MGDFRKAVDDMTDLIISCWDCNQELDSNGKPVDGLTFDERLAKKTADLKGLEKEVIDSSVNW